MISDRYVPDADDYDFASGSPARHQRSSRDDSRRHNKEEQGGAAKRSKHSDKPRHREASVNDVEDGEIVEAEAAGDGASPHGKGSTGAGVTTATTADAAANGKHRYPAVQGADAEQPDAKARSGSPTASAGAGKQATTSAQPPSSKRDRSRSRDRSSKRERHKERERDRGDRGDRDRERDRGDRDRERDRHRSSRDGSRDRSKGRHHSREPSQGRELPGGPSSPHRASGGRAAADAAALPPPPRDRSSSRARAEGDGGSRRVMDDSPRGDRYRSDSSSRAAAEGRERERGRDLEQRERQRREQWEQRPAPMGFEERQRLREMERGRDGSDGRKRRSRSRSRSRGRGGWRERDDERSYKRSRDEGRERRHSSPEMELDLDPNALLETDALGLSKAEKEAEEEARRLEESRRRRQAILAKHQQAAAVAAPTATAAAAAAAGAPADAQQQQQQQSQEPPLPSQLQQQQQELPASQQQQQQEEAAEAAGAASPAAAAAAAGVDGTATPEGERSSSEDSHNAPGEPVMDIWNTAGTNADEASSRPGDAAPEEPTSQLPAHLVVPGTEPNMQSERLRVALPHSAAAGAAGGAVGQAAGGAAAAAGGAAEAAQQEGGGGGDDMFAADDDMFAEEGDGAGGVKRQQVVPAGLMDNYDDAEGYYNFQVGELLDGRYEVFACKGRGVFSTVLRARDKLKLVPNPLTGAEEHAEVAIKVIRANETMAKAAALEQRILRLLSDRDPENRRHVIRLLRAFEYRHHVCMVFEPMDMNLRELTLKYGRNVGLNITAVGVYAAQMLVALRHLHQCGVLHADIKPDNILVNARRSKVKICDLGSAMLAGENERTPYLVSRFYRSPEVILGLAYDFPMDMWSVGCVLYELFTGRILFPGRTNNDMLKLMMDVKGPFPKKMLKKGIFVEKHFEPDAQLSFSLVEEDPVTKQPVRRLISNPTVKHNFSQLLARAEGDKQQVAQLADLLEKMLALDPDKRISADSALRHDFIKPFLPKKKSGKH